MGVPYCPRCGSPAIPILFGLPTAEAAEAGKAGRILLAGCFEHDDRWACTGPDRHTWADANEEAWLTAIDEALRPVSDGRSRS